jgi:rubrerythrin
MANDELELRESKTWENLRSAFASSCMDAARYAWFATRADLEGELELAGLFRAAAQGEGQQAQGHLDYLREAGDPQTRAPIGTSEQNLKAAINRATYEAETLWTGFARTAREEGFDAVADWFEGLARAGRRRLELLHQARRGGSAVSLEDSAELG